MHIVCCIYMLELASLVVSLQALRSFHIQYSNTKAKEKAIASNIQPSRYYEYTAR